jgi:hypothetical protein
MRVKEGASAFDEPANNLAKKGAAATSFTKSLRSAMRVSLVPSPLAATWPMLRPTPEQVNKNSAAFPQSFAMNGSL